MQEVDEKAAHQEGLKNKVSKASPTRTRIIIVSFGVVIILIALILLLGENTKTQDTRSRAQQVGETVAEEVNQPVTDEESSEVKVNSPKQDEVLMDPVKIEATTGSLSVQSVEFWLDNEQEPYYTATEQPYSIVVSDLRPGRHTVFVKAQLSDQNIKSSEPVSFRVTPNSASLIKEKGEKE